MDGTYTLRACTSGENGECEPHEATQRACVDRPTTQFGVSCDFCLLYLGLSISLRDLEPCLNPWSIVP